MFFIKGHLKMHQLKTFAVTVAALSFIQSAPAVADKNVDIHCLIPVIKAIAKDPELVNLVDKHNEKVKKPQDIMSIDKLWESLDAESEFLNDILYNKISAKLRDTVNENSYFDEVFAADHYGTIIAASNKTTDYFQADEDFFQHIITYGSGGIFIASSQPDVSAKSIGQKIAVPITLDGAVIGVLGVITNTWYNEYYKACDSNK
jgi:hypothetical protein